MEKVIPKISFRKDQILDIEVLNFSQLYDKLAKTKTHNPFAVHKIEFFLILVLTKKSYSHFVDFNSYTLVEGSALFIAKNQVHHFTESIKKAEGYCIIFNGLFSDKHNFLFGNMKLNRVFNYHIERPVITQLEMKQDTFSDIAKELFDEYTLPNKFVKSEILSTLLQVLFLKAERAKEIQSINSIQEQWLNTFSSFKDLLEKEYINTRSSRNYAAKLFISYKFLNDIVKKATGKTVKAFIDDFVIIEIKRYLVSTSLTVNEISYMTGFEEPANMIKFFKKRMYTTPLKFRQQK